MKRIKFCFYSIFAIIALSTTMAAHADFTEGSAALSSGNPHIPEPLLFDLVRPLGAKKGELEINTLAQQGINGGPLEWAPEIEYAIADGLAFELELPTENSEVTDYKVALQGTFSNNFGNPNMIQGWQVIAKKNRDTAKYSSDILYINGYRFLGQWSTLNMIGLRKPEFGKSSNASGLINNNLFYDLTPRYTFGLELNHEVSSKGQWRYSVTPQVHMDINSNVTIQAGTGISKLNLAKKSEKLFGLRMIYAF